MSTEFEVLPANIQRFPIELPNGENQEMWDLERLTQVPETCLAGDIDGVEEEPGIQALFYEGVRYQGKPTQAFAWIGIPQHPAGERVPGMVLVHGGGGTAFKDWVKLWMERGYAAIAMDTCGHVPVRPEGQTDGWIRHTKNPGPVGWGGFDQIDEPIEDQWTYHAVSAVILGHTLLRSIPEVDASRIGLTGISWGGYLTNIVAGVDSRFRFAAPVYGCGFLGENSTWLENQLHDMPSRDAETWVRLWDPARYVGFTSLPMLYCNGTNDIHYRMDSWQKTYRTVKSPRTLCCKVRMPHGHPPAGDPPEITACADAILKNGIALPRITGQGMDERILWATFDPETPVTKAGLNVTRDTGRWEKRNWDMLSAAVNADSSRVFATVPEGATAAFLNLFDSRDLIVSTEHISLP